MFALGEAVWCPMKRALCLQVLKDSDVLTWIFQHMEKHFTMLSQCVVLFFIQVDQSNQRLAHKS